MANQSPFYSEAKEYLYRNSNLPDVYTFDYADLTFIGLNTVFSPPIFEDSYFFSEALEIKSGEKFLEVGCGTGIISVLKAIGGAHVTACDINSTALKNTRINAILHDVDSTVKTVHSDVFDNIDDLLSFDIIFWNMPFIYTDTPIDDELDAACFSYKYDSIRRFLAQAETLIKANSRVLFGFSRDSGNFEDLKRIVSEFGLKQLLIREKNLAEDDEPTFTVSLYELGV